MCSLVRLLKLLAAIVCCWSIARLQGQGIVIMIWMIADVLYIIVRLQHVTWLVCRSSPQIKLLAPTVDPPISGFNSSEIHAWLHIIALILEPLIKQQRSEVLIHESGNWKFLSSGRKLRPRFGYCSEIWREMKPY